jgi:hypothetical protein
MKDVIEMAREAGFDCTDSYIYHPDTYDNASLDTYLERFAVLVRKDEREACAKVAEDSDHVVSGRGYYDQLGDADATVRNIVAAIRNRGNT